MKKFSTRIFKYFQLIVRFFTKLPEKDIRKGGSTPNAYQPTIRTDQIN